MNKLRIMLSIICISILLISGCSNKEYEDFTKAFNNYYFEVAESVNIENTLNTLESLNSHDNSKRIEEMGVLLENIKGKVPDDKIEHYDTLIEWYNAILYLREAYERWPNLTIEEKTRVHTEIISIDIRRDN